MEDAVVMDVPAKAVAVDWRRLLLGTLVYWPLIVAGAALGAMAVLPVSHRLAKLEKKDFAAETILNFQPVGENARYVDSKTTVTTLKDMVKIRENLEEVRHRLGWSEPVTQIGKALDVRVGKNTTLLVIEAKWKTRLGAAALANTTRAVFLERYNNRTRLKMDRELGDLQKRLERVRGALRQEDALRSSFTAANKIVDIEKESRALLEEYNNYGVLLEQAQAERKTVEEQAIKLDHAINELKQRVRKESQNFSQLENLADVNTRIERIRDTIHEDQESRKNIALFALKQKELERAKNLLEKGYIAQAVYDKALAEWEAQRAITEDTAQTQHLREERERLQKQIVPSANNPSAAPSAPILQTMLVRTFDIQLQKIAVQKKVLSLEEARKRVKSRLDQMPGFQQQYDALERNISGREVERKEIESRIAQKLRDAESSLQDFSLVTEATAPPAPGKNMMVTLIPLVLPVLGGIVGLALAGLLSWRAAQVKPLLPLLSNLPRRQHAAYRERFQECAQQVRQALGPNGGALLLSGSASEEAVTDLSRRLALYWRNRGVRVAVVDTRPGISPDPSLECSSDPAQLPELQRHYDLVIALGEAAQRYVGFTILLTPPRQSGTRALRRLIRQLPPELEPIGQIVIAE